MPAPDFNDWSVKARSLYPDVSEDDLKGAFETKYGQGAVRTAGPTFDEFQTKAKELYPDTPDDAIKSAYHEKYGTGVGTSTARGFKSAFAEGGKLVGGLVGGLGRATGLGDETGQNIFDYWQNVQDQNTPARELQGNVVDNPGLLAKPGWWGQGLGGAAATFANPAGLVLGGAQHGADVYDRTGSLAKGVAVGVGETALNLMPLGGNMGRLARGALFGAAGAAQPVIEAAATGDSMTEAAKQGVGQFPFGFALGAAFPGGHGERAAGVNPEEAAFRARMGMEAGVPGAGSGPAAPTMDQFTNASTLGARLALPPPETPAPAPDFSVDPRGNVMRPGETVPAPSALPPPAPGGFMVGPEGEATPVTQAQMEAPKPQRAEAVAMGMGEAARIQARMVQGRGISAQKEFDAALAPPAESAPAVELPNASGAMPPIDVKTLPLADRLKQDADLRRSMDIFKGETGWWQAGGKMIRRNADGSLDEDNRNRGNAFEISRTTWIPNSPWYKLKPDGMSEQGVKNAIDRAMAGKKLGSNQEKMLRILVDEHDTRQANVPALPTRQETAAAGLSHNDRNAQDMALVARASEIDSDAVESLAKQHEDNHEAFLQGVKGIVDSANAGAGSHDGGPPGASPSQLPTDTGRGPEPAAGIVDAGQSGAERSGGIEDRKRAYYSSNRSYASQHGQMPLDLRFETRPDTTPQQVANGRKVLASLISERDRRAGASVLAHGITQDFIDKGHTSLVGKEIRDPHDLGLLAQVYRNPYTETLRVFYMRGNEVAGVSGLASRLPSMVTWPADKYPQLVADGMRAYGADGYYVQHNHPAGFAHPSDGDRYVTQLLHREVRGLKGHIVIDHNEYSIIQGNGHFQTIKKDLGSFDPKSNPQIPHKNLFDTIRNASELATLSKQFEKPGFTTIVGLDSRMRVRSIADYPDALLTSTRSQADVMRAVARIRRQGRIGGADSVMMAVTADKSKVQHLLDAGVLNDVLVHGTGKMHSQTVGRLTTGPGQIGDRNKTRQFVQDEAKGYATQTDQVQDPNRAERVDVGGGSYSMKQFGQLNDTEHAVLTGVMRDLEQPIANQRRGTRTWNATEEAAMKMISKKYGITMDQLVNRKKGSTANAEQLEAYAQMLSGASKALTDAAAEVARTNSNESIAKLGLLREKLGVMLAPAMGYRTEAGRALNILAKTAGDFKQADKLFEALGDGSHDSLRGFAKKLAETDNPDQIIGVTRESYTPDWLDKLLEYRVSMGLLSGPATHAVNIASNAMFNALELGTHALASTFSKALPFEAVRARIAATAHGTTLGLTNAKRAFLTEEGQITPKGKIETRPHAIGGKLGKAIRIPTRALMAEDEVFKSVAFHQHLADLAMREAVAKNPRDAQNEFHRIMGDVLNRTDLVDAAHKEAERLTFQDPLGPYMGMLSAAASKGSGRLVRLIIPFIRTPTNILKRAVEYTPAGYTQQAVRDALSRGGADAALAHSRVAIGSGIMLSVLGLAGSGMLSGNGPEDKAERDLWLREGNQPYSVKIGDKWVRYNRFDPMGTIMGVAADMYEIGHAATNDQLDKVGSMLMTSIALNLGDKSFLQGITDFANAYSDPKRYMQRWATGMATSLIPNAGAQFAREVDPYQREARTLVDAIKAKIPGMREDLARRLDVSGQPQEAIGTGFGSPIQATDARPDAVANAMLELGVYKGKPSRNFSLQKRDIQLSDEEYEPYAAFVQQARWRQLTPMVQSPQFRQMMKAAPIQAQDMLKRAYTKIGDDAHMAYLYRNPQLVSKILNQPRKTTISPSSYASEQ